VRHVRMLGLCLVAAVALGAVAAVPALAKEKYSPTTFTQYKGCPFNDPAVEYCYLGQTSGGSKGGFFELGKMTVKLAKPITIQGGLSGEGETVNVFPATNGYQTLESPELKVGGGLNVVTPKIQEEAGWPEALKQSFKEAKKNKETGLNVKIELAGGNRLYETPGSISTQNLLEANGPAFTLPLKVRMISPWLEKLGGGPCEIGSEENPVTQYLTSAKPGHPGTFFEAFEFNIAGFKESRLVDLGWSVEPASDANGCGSGEDEAYVNAAINKVLELPGQVGITVLTGNLYSANTVTVREHEAEV
jgi:hypothetical protein